MKVKFTTLNKEANSDNKPEVITDAKMVALLVKQQAQEKSALAAKNDVVLKQQTNSRKPQESIESEESRGEAEPPIEELPCSDESINSGEISSDDDLFDGVIDTSTLRKTAYPSAGNQNSNQATPASK